MLSQCSKTQIVQHNPAPTIYSSIQEVCFSSSPKAVTGICKSKRVILSLTAVSFWPALGNERKIISRIISHFDCNFSTGYSDAVMMSILRLPSVVNWQSGFSL